MTDKLADMLQENTGKHFLDSGGAYGRNWERNQGVDFDATLEGTLEFWNRNGELEIDATLSVYHWLKDRLDYNPELDERYRKFVGEEGDLDIHSAELFAATMVNGKGIYGEGSPLTVNTYNGEDLLSQIIQYVYWTDEDDEAHILLQIHGGCDARGGYMDPVAFDVGETDIFDNARATIYCECGKYWDTDDGCNWAPDGCRGRDFTNLEDYPATEDRPDYPVPDDSDQLALFDDKRKTPDTGVIWVKDDKGHCPHCGGVLNIAPWPAG